MGRIITYKNEGGYCFSQIELESGERILISVSTKEFTVKIFQMLADGTTPDRIAFLIDLTNATDIFLKKEDWGKQGIILDKVIEAVKDSKSILGMVEKLDQLVS